MIYEVTISGRLRRVEVKRQGDLWHCRIDEREWFVNVAQPCPEVLSLLIDGRTYEIRRDRTAQGTQIWVEGMRFSIEVRDPRSLKAHRATTSSGDGPQKLVASMPGKVVRVLRSADEPVEPGDGILVVEAMKMQNELKSPKKGVIRQVLAKEGAAVNAGDVLAIVE
jgi:biotin carboxyl carrier protein